MDAITNVEACPLKGSLHGIKYTAPGGNVANLIRKDEILLEPRRLRSLALELMTILLLPQSVQGERDQRDNAVL